MSGSFTVQALVRRVHLFTLKVFLSAIEEGQIGRAARPGVHEVARSLAAAKTWRRSQPRRRAVRRGRRGRCYDAPMGGEPHIRKVRPDDLEEVWRVRVAASNDLMVGRGQAATRPADAPVASDARAGLASDPDGYFCAVEEERIRGMVSALVRGRVWYLSMFFVLPGDQGRGLAGAARAGVGLR